MLFRSKAAAGAAVMALGGAVYGSVFAGAARAEVQKFMNTCTNQQICASYQLVLTPPAGWVLDNDATAKTKVQIIVPTGKTFATAEPLLYVQVFYHEDKGQTLGEFARTSNERWMQINPTAKISDLPAVDRTNGKPGFLRFAFLNPKKPQQAYEVAAFGVDSDKDGNEYVLDVVMSASSKQALDRAEKDYVAFLKAH
jgi:hypothetical protein